MIELKKEQLLFYFPYAPRKEHIINENRSIYDVLRQIEGILWQALSTGNSNRPADIELKLIDYQADVSKRKADFEKMREDLSEDEKKQQQSFAAKHQEIIKNHVPAETLQQYGNGSIPWSAADDPKAFAKEYKKLEDKYQDLQDRLVEIEEAFQKKMKGVSSVKLPNTDPFTIQEARELRGALIKAVRPLIHRDKVLEEEVSEIKNGKHPA